LRFAARGGAGLRLGVVRFADFFGRAGKAIPFRFDCAADGEQRREFAPVTVEVNILALRFAGIEGRHPIFPCGYTGNPHV
jgi:hypothetical protein